MASAITGVIFAKRSERYPGKHSVKIFDSTLIDLVASRVIESRLLKRVVIYSKDPEIKSEVCEVVRDETEGTIVSSILTALEKFGDIFAIAGDMPCADPQMIDAMLQSFNGKAVVPLKEDKQIEPMHAIYCSSTVSVLKKNIEERRLSIREFIEAIPHSFFNIPRNREFSFYNVNYPSDLVYIQRNGCQ